MKNNHFSDIQYLVWDVDGTIFDTNPSFFRAISQALAELGIDPDPAWLEELVYLSLETSFNQLGERYSLDPMQLLESYRKYYLQIPLEQQPLFPGVLEVCTYIQRSGGQNFIFTHRRRMTLQYLLDHYDLASYFSHAVTRDDGYADKPDPTGLLVILQRYQLNPHQVLMIGDRDMDIQAGKAAGVYTCLFGSNALSSPADIFITDYTKLLEILQSKAVTK